MKEFYKIVASQIALCLFSILRLIYVTFDLCSFLCVP